MRDLSQDEAIVRMVDSNLQRDIILPSEKAWAYKMRYDAMKRQAGRSNKNKVPLGHNNGKSSRELLSEQVPDSNTQIQRYIRLTELIPPLLVLVDNNKIAIRPAVELSYLTQEQQNVLFDVIGYEESTPSQAQATEMRKLSSEGVLTDKAIHSIMREEKINKPKQFKIPRERIGRFFPKETTEKEIADTIVKALELWYKKRQ